MTAEREPDMSLPTAIEGVPVADVIIPPPDHDVARLAMMRQEKLTKSTAKHEIMTAKWSITKSLAHCEIDGDKVDKNTEYWKQPLDSVITQKELQHKEATNKEPFSYENVTYDSHTPDYEVSSGGK